MSVSLYLFLHHKGETVFQESATISPTQVYKHDYGMVDLTEEELELQVLSAQGDCLVKYHPEKKKITQVPEPAKPATKRPAKPPVKCLAARPIPAAAQPTANKAPFS